MINYIKGEITYISENFVIIENNGIGYNIQVSENTRSSLSLGENVKLYTYMNVKEDGINLFGFLSMDEIDIFNKLISVSGVGPKAALAILAVMSPADVVLAIITDDIKALSQGQGIGKKIAQRIALELKDKVDTFDYSDIQLEANGVSISTKSNEMNGEKQDAIDGLIALGFGKSETVKAVMETTDDLSSAEIIKIVLKKLSAK